MAVLKGNMYGVMVNGEFLQCEISCEITITTDMLEKSGSHGGRYKHFRPGYISWAISAESRAVLNLLSTSSNNLIVSQLDQLELEVYISARQSNVQTFDIGGSVFISSQQLSFGNTGFASHNLTMQGTSALNLTADELEGIINSNPIEANYPIINQN